MKLLDRVLVFFLSLFVTVASALGVWFVSGLGLSKYDTVRLIEALYAYPARQWTAVGLSLLLMLIGLRLLVATVRRPGADRGVDRLTEIGYIRISLDTLESLAVKAARRVRGIRDLTARVRMSGNNASVGVGLKLTVDGETPIQTLTEELQRVVKTHIEEIAGVTVDQISVYVTDTVQPDRTRIRVE